MQADEVGGFDKLVQRDELHAEFPRDLRIEIGIHGLDVELQSLRARSDLATDVAEPDDAHRSSRDAVDAAAIGVQLGCMAPPAALAHVLVHAHEFSRDGDQQADGLLRNFDRVATRRVADSDAALRRGLEIHSIDANAGPADDLAAPELRDNLASEGGRAMQDHRVRITTRFCHLLVCLRPRDHQLRVDLVEDRLDQIDGNLVAAAVNDTESSHL